MFALSQLLPFLLLVQGGLSIASVIEGLHPTSPVFSWKTLQSTHGRLRWTPCEEKFECARLTVPLNYSNPNAATASIALVRIPALVSPKSASYSGPILFNPGGPGNSGVEFVQAFGDLLRKIVGPTFDLIGFDPRGVQRSTPIASFYNSDAERVQWEWKDFFPINATEGRLAGALAHAQISTTLAEERDRDRHVLAHINTENTARDILRIVEAHGLKKIQYWGFSYGATLGAVFATLFPDKVGRMVIDAVPDAEDYWRGDWENNMLDTDRTWGHFFSGCQAAGPSRCALYASSQEEIERHVQSILDKIKARPVPVRTKVHYGVIDYDFVRAVMFQSLYRPYTMYQPLAAGLADLERGNGTRLMELSRGSASTIFECSSCSGQEKHPRLNTEARMTIYCNDARVSRFNTLEDAEGHLERLLKFSQWGDMWAQLGILCSGWPAFPKPFGGPLGANTSHPLLVVGNTADPVTPLWAARRASESFPKSVLLTQNSAGHVSILASSSCTHKYIGDYFRNGTLPTRNTTCEVDVELFP